MIQKKTHLCVWQGGNFSTTYARIFWSRQGFSAAPVLHSLIKHSRLKLPDVLRTPGPYCASFFGSPKAVVSPPHLLQRAGSAACRHDQNKEHACDCFVIPALRAGNPVEIAGFCSMRRDCVWQEATFPPRMRGFGSRQGLPAAPVRTVKAVAQDPVLLS